MTKKMGRPRIELNWEEFEKLCEIQCTAEEIAGWFRCSVDTIERSVKRKFNQTFAEVKAQRQTKGQIACRRQLMQLVLKGHFGAIVWFGKNHCGMTEKVEQKTELTGKDGGPQVIVMLPDNDFSVKNEPTSN